MVTEGLFGFRMSLLQFLAAFGVYYASGLNIVTALQHMTSIVALE